MPVSVFSQVTAPGLGWLLADVTLLKSSMSDPIATVRLKPRRALPFFSQHPWVFTGAIGSVSGMPDVGAPVIVQSHEGEFIAHGLFNPASNIRVRLYSWDEQTPLCEELIRGRIRTAVNFRRRLFDGDSAWNACRLIFSEADGLSGLTVDRVADWLVVQWTSAALLGMQECVLDELQQLLSPRGIWLRTERGMKSREGMNLDDGLVRGEEPPTELEIVENGIRFSVDLQSGQKTGFYFDQRDNRALLKRYGRQGRLLDVCTYSGGFALAGAVLGDCREVIALDSSTAALDLAAQNATLNGVEERIQYICDDMFDGLEALVAEGERFDVVVLDPPKLARSRSGLDRALKAYTRLNLLAMQLLNPDGILITCSCSGHVLREDFEQVIAKASLEAQRSVQILEERGQAPDHPVATTCLETAYLKCFVCRVV